MDSQSTATTHKSKKSKPNASMIIGAIVFTIILSSLSFMGGVTYQKSQPQNNQVTNPYGSPPNGDQGIGSRGMQRNGIIGTVISVSATSISVNNQRTGTTSTKAIAASTTIKDNDSSAAVGNIKVGDVVFITTSTSDSNTAAQISINPNFAGGPRGSDDTSQNLQVN